jgi:hypothetical protein
MSLNQFLLPTMLPETMQCVAAAKAYMLDTFDFMILDVIQVWVLQSS